MKFLAVVLSSLVLAACGGGGSSTPASSQVGGKVSGLAPGTAIGLANGTERLTISANGTFVFLTKLAPGTAFNITIASQPDKQLCTLASASGTAAGADITNISVTCASLTPAQAISKLEQSGRLPILDRSTSIPGPDANNNGIRDDVDAWLQSQHLTGNSLSGATKLAQASQQALSVDLANQQAVGAVANQMTAAIVCLRTSVADATEAKRIARTLEAITANTQVRAEKYFAFNQAMNGSVVKLPGRGVSCGQ